MRRKPLLFAALLAVISGFMLLHGAESILDGARSLPARGARTYDAAPLKRALEWTERSGAGEDVSGRSIAGT